MTLAEIKKMVARLDYLDRKAAILTRRAKEAKAAADAHEFEVSKAMEDAGMEVGEDITYNGTRWARRVDYYAKVQDPFEFSTWAEANAPHLLRSPGPAKAELNRLIVQSMDDGQPLPPGVGAVPKIWVSRHAK